MADFLIPLGGLLSLGLLVFAFVHTARSQRSAKHELFRELAARLGLHYEREDTGRAMVFAGDFDGLGNFSSPSLGEVKPSDVVTGSWQGDDVVFFRHHQRLTEGWAREWYVVGLEYREAVADACAVQICRRSSDRESMFLRDPIVKEYAADRRRIVVRAPSIAAAGGLTDEAVLRRIAELAASCTLRPELQVRGARLAAYPADRNATPDIDALLDLVTFVKRTAALCAPRKARS